MGLIKKSNNEAGYELNFWAMPIYDSTTGSKTIMVASGAIEITFGYNANDVQMGYGMNVGGLTLY